MPSYFTTREAADIMKMSLQVLRRWIRKGKLPVSKISPKKFLIDGKDLEAFVASHKS